MRYLFSVILYSLLIACAPSKHDDDDGLYMTICYIPIGSGTFVPMTRKNFAKQCTNLGRLPQTDSRYEKIFAALNDRSRNGIFDEYAVRVTVNFSNGRMILVDQEGVVESAGVQTRMSTSALAEVERILDELEEKIGPKVN